MDPAYLMPKFGIRSLLVHPGGPTIDVEVTIDSSGFVIDSIQQLVGGDTEPIALDGQAPGRGLVAWINATGDGTLERNPEASAAITALAGRSLGGDFRGPVLFTARIRDTGDVSPLTLEELAVLKDQLGGQ